MIQSAYAFFILAIIVYVLGAKGIAGVSMNIGIILVWVFLILAGISFIASFFYKTKKSTYL